MKSLQRADRWLGRTACALMQPLRVHRRRPAREEPRRLLLIKFWGMGSLQLLTAAVRALRTRHPKAEIVLLTLEQNREFASGLLSFDRVLSLDVATGSWLRIVRRILGLVRGLRAERFDAVYDFEFFTRFSAVISRLSGAPQTYGFASPSVWRGGFHTATAPFNRYWHVARNFRSLAGGESGEDVVPGELSTFAIGPRHEAEVDELLAELTWEGSTGLVVLNPNAGTLSLERRWPKSHFAGLARKLIRDHGLRVVLIGAPGEVRWTAEVEALVGGVPPGLLVNAAGRLSAGGMCAILARADAFVSNDSGPMHVAAALGTPTIGLFGPETPVMYRPLGPRARALYDPPACSPCINVHQNKLAVCSRGRPECLIGISVEGVLAALLDELRESRLRVVRPEAAFEIGR
jgi:lipopolysaccharide heptosyltransferase II